MVTICTKDRECFFGEILNGKMELSEIGKQADKFWNNIPLYNHHVLLGEYVIMPDHIHGIIGIVGDCKDVALQRLYLPNGKNQFMSSISPKSGSLSVVIRSFKSALTKWCKQNGHFLFDWLPRFHDRIIRNQSEYDRIEEYIRKNPEKWNSQNRGSATSPI